MRQLSRRKLAAEVKRLETLAEGRLQLIAALEARARTLEAKVRERIDVAMIHERIALANALGQMMHQTCDAVKWIIAKEAL